MIKIKSIPCGQIQGAANCPNDALFRFTWPGRNESTICLECAPKLKGVANVMGLPLQLIPIEPVILDEDGEI